jgi:hypothetical protein
VPYEQRRHGIEQLLPAKPTPPTRFATVVLQVQTPLTIAEASATKLPFVKLTPMTLPAVTNVLSCAEAVVRSP